MNKRDLIDAISGRLGDKKSATEALNAVLETIQSAVASGDKVAITGFGVFEKSERPARTARNPATGDRDRRWPRPRCRSSAPGRTSRPWSTGTSRPRRRRRRRALHRQGCATLSQRVSESTTALAEGGRGRRSSRPLVTAGVRSTGGPGIVPVGRLMRGRTSVVGTSPGGGLARDRLTIGRREPRRSYRGPSRLGQRGRR